MFWKNKELEKLKQLTDRLDHHAGIFVDHATGIRENRESLIAFENKFKEELQFTDTQNKAILVLEQKFKDLETMCLTTISQLQNVQLAHAERLRSLENKPEEILDNNSLDSTLVEAQRQVEKMKKKTKDKMNIITVEIPKVLA